jgi:hypothetical protein
VLRSCCEEPDTFAAHSEAVLGVVAGSGDKPSSDIDMYSTDLDIIGSSLIDPSPP